MIKIIISKKIKLLVSALAFTLTSCGNGTQSPIQPSPENSHDYLLVTTVEVNNAITTYSPVTENTDAQQLEPVSAFATLAVTDQTTAPTGPVETANTSESVIASTPSVDASADSHHEASENESSSAKENDIVIPNANLSVLEPVAERTPVSSVPTSPTEQPEQPEQPAQPETTDITPTEVPTTIAPSVLPEPIETETTPPLESEHPRAISIGSHSGDVVKILDKHIVSTSQLMVQQTPIDTRNGYVYTANIEHGVNGDENGINLKTVVRQGTQNTDGSWTWASKLIEDRTVYDQWHTAPSVAVDNTGFVHVTYNMHNFPWQYKISTSPNSIEGFEFRGQAISDAELARSKFENKTTFPTLGHAAIPGNQITYPAFYKDRNHDLYISYRFAAKPKRSFEDRTMSAGLAAYDAQLKTWSAIGAPISVQEGYDYDAHLDADLQPKSVASDTGWTVYHPRLTFGPSNTLNVIVFFRPGIAGAELSKPCFITSQDRFSFEDLSGSSVSLPLAANDCGNMGYSDEQEFYSMGSSTMDSSGNPHIVLSPHNSARKIGTYNQTSNAWTYVDSPDNASEIFFDAEDNLWAVSTGIKVMVKANGSSTWSTVYEDAENASCFPKVTVNESMDTAFIHTHACDQKTITVYGLRLN